MRTVWFLGVLIALVPLVTLEIFNGLTIAGLAVVVFATYRVIKKDGLA